MDGPSGRSRSRFRLPRVEFDLSALLLGMLGYLAYQISWYALALGLSPQVSMGEGATRTANGGELLNQFFFTVGGHLKLPYFPQVAEQLGWTRTAVMDSETKIVRALDFVPGLELPWWHVAVICVVLLLVWSVFGGALARAHAVRISRDSSVPVTEALAFSIGNLRGFLLAPLFVVTAAVFFAGLVALAGAASAIPYVGFAIQAVLHPLALLGGLVVAIIAVGGVFGFPVTHAALATEKNGSLDAVSRTYAYVFSRPVLFILSVMVVFVIASMIHQFGGWFVDATDRALLLGAGWSDEARTAMGSGFADGGRGLLFTPTAAEGQSVPLTRWVSWFWTSVAVLVVKGYVLAYIVGGLTDVYFMLRREVDGIDDTQVYVEGETADLGPPLPGQPAEPVAEE